MYDLRKLNLMSPYCLLKFFFQRSRTDWCMVMNTVKRKAFVIVYNYLPWHPVLQYVRKEW